MMLINWLFWFLPEAWVEILKEFDYFAIFGPIVTACVLFYNMILLARSLIKNNKRKGRSKKSKRKEKLELLQRLKLAKLELEAEKHVTSKKRAIWQLIPLTLLTCWNVSKVSFYNPGWALPRMPFVRETFEQKLTRYDPNWRINLKWNTQLENKAYLFQNGTQVFENGTRLFYNMSVLHPNGTLTHVSNITYFDIAESRAYLSDDIKEDHCGFKTESFQFASWGCTRVAGKCKTEMPIVLPESDHDLINYVRSISDKQCVIRAVGLGQTMGGLVTDESELYTVGISFAKYTPDDKIWTLDNLKLLDHSRVRVAAGKTLLDLYAVIRPLGYFLPSQPSSWEATIGSIVTNTIYGSGFGESSLNLYVTGLRVMYSNGTVSEIFDEAELSIWRGSMGLLGLVTAAEFRVETRSNFVMGSRSSVLPHWNKWVLDEAIADLLPGAKGAHYLFDPWMDELFGIGYVDSKVKTRGSGYTPTSDTDCVFSLISMSCADPDFCFLSPQIGDFLPSHSCRLKNHFKKQYSHVATKPFYNGISSRYKSNLAMYGLPSAQTTFNELSGVVSSAIKWAFDSMPLKPNNATLNAESRKMFHVSKQSVNDGFWQLGLRKTASMSYAFPVECLFDALDKYRHIVHDLVDNNAQYNLLDEPLVFSFFKPAGPSVLLHPRSSELGGGHYVSINVRVKMNFVGDNSPWAVLLERLEADWISLECGYGAVFPLVGGVFAFHNGSMGKDGLVHENGEDYDDEYSDDDDQSSIQKQIQPFLNLKILSRVSIHVDNPITYITFQMNYLFYSIFSLETQERFLKYHQKVDPGNHFWGGRATKLFADKYQPEEFGNLKSLAKETCFHTWTLTVTCIAAVSVLSGYI